MAVSIDLSAPHRIVAANAHFYKEPTEPLYIDRVMQLHDLIYLVDGEWTITENETNYALKKDDVLLLAAGRHHYTRQPCLPNTRTICVHVSCELGDRAEVGRALHLPSRIHVSSVSYAKQYFEEILAAMWSESPHKHRRMSALFDLLICELADQHDLATARKNDISMEIMRMVNTAQQRFYKVQEIVDIFNINPKQLDRVMRRSTGMTFSAFQMNRKLEMVALQLLVEPDARLKEIAAALGFCDEFHMSKSLKRKYGVAPAQYRQEGERAASQEEGRPVA